MTALARCRRTSAAASPDHGACNGDDAALQAPCTGPATSRPSAWDRATDAARARALERLAAVDRSDGGKASGLSRAEADAIAGIEVGVSASAVAAWRRRLKGVAAEGRAAALLDAPREGRPRREWSGPGAEALWVHFLTDYLRPEAPPASASWGHARRIADHKGWTMPPYRAFLRRLRREVPRPELVRAREGRVAAMDLVPHVSRTVAGLYPLAIINGDGKVHDCWIVLPSGKAGRPVVWYWQDVYTRRILAWAAGESESAALIRTSLHEVITTHGLPGKVVLDNTRAASAKAITGGQRARKRNRVAKGARPVDDELPGVLKLLGIAYATTSVDMDDGGRGVGRGRAKPIERAFGDLCTRIDTHPLLAGSYTGRSTSDRPETHRMRAAPWETFIEVVSDCVAAHNTQSGRRTEIAAGRSFDEAWNEALAGTVVRKIGDAQARVLLLSTERVRIGRDGAFHLNAGRVPHRPPNRYHDPILVARAGEMLVARFDPDHLHGSCLVYDAAGRFICEAACLMPVGFDNHADVGKHERARRRMERSTRKTLEARRDMDALRDGLAAAGPPVIPPAAEPAAVELVTGEQLPEVPRHDARRSLSKGDLLGAIEARRRAYGMSPADLCRLIKNALGKQVVSPKQLSVANLMRIEEMLADDVVDTAPAPRPRSRFMAALKTVQQLEEDEG